METTLGIIGFVVALVVTPVYLLLVAKGVRSLSDIRDVVRRPPEGSGRRTSRGEQGSARSRDPDES